MVASVAVRHAPPASLPQGSLSITKGETESRNLLAAFFDRFAHVRRDST